ncbi:tumor necrosis factor receptor type 1-associated DEATH domain protein [Amia ocellicauda]|uniref:tumor necrosis factor receptor type 1-associated DEATH domain protein n=1 Tax=Amia ocellicauda TaxID=2972642 RepID=UPI0034642470
MDGKKLMSNCGSGSWTGSVFLFLQSDSAHIDLLDLYKEDDQKFNIFKALKLALSDAVGGLEGYEVLKVHDAQPSLGVLIKFVEEAKCRRFLQSYSSGSVQQFFGQHLSHLLPTEEEIPITTQLKAGSETLDDFLKDEDLCLQHIHREQPDRLRDDEVSELEQKLQSLLVGERAPQASISLVKDPTLAPNCFYFQSRVFDDRQLTVADHQCFASNVGKDWKKVGRSLQKSCRALAGSAIDNLAYEYEREGLYEQAYQLLSKFMQAEGKAATLSRLITALEENKLVGMAEIMLKIQPTE